MDQHLGLRVQGNVTRSGRTAGNIHAVRGGLTAAASLGSGSGENRRHDDGQKNDGVLEHGGCGGWFFERAAVMAPKLVY